MSSRDPMINNESDARFLDDRDWQVTTILSDALFIETDCNSGEKRRIRRSVCACGQPFLIQYEVSGFRKDRKRVFYPHHDHEGYDAFRCEACLEPVAQSVPYAEYD